MAAGATSQQRVNVVGKFFRLGAEKFHLKGVAYGPFAPDALGEPFVSPEQTARDFGQMRELGANVARIYHVPPRWFLDLAAEHGLKLLIDVPWSKHSCFLDSESSRDETRAAVRRAARLCAGHPAVFALSVVNEIPPDIVRWSGARAVADFIDELINEVKAVDPECLCTFTSFPPTEFLRPQNPDFLCFNVYLHQRRPFENYLARLQMIADDKPLVLGEFGIDSIREGEAQKCEILAWQIAMVFRGGLAGAVLFSFTDEWHRGGKAVADWAFGVTAFDRRPKESFAVVQKAFRTAPYPALGRYPKVSVVVASYNGARTLKACLESLTRLNYPDYEVILVDDGSTDTTPQVASVYKNIRCFRQDNQGLSAARNAGIAAATGEIVAFTDSDCRADEDWLYHLIGDLLNGDFAGIGGHNLLPPEDSWVAASVLVSPGGPAHVMLTDREAEHVPGCNMAFYKWALEEIGGFDPVFRKAGDDVDVCWRLQERGYKIGFSPSGFVWHYRRSNVAAYLKQQHGYGEAEALLVRKHPEYFSTLGGGIWRGRIYTSSKFGVIPRRPIIYHGVFGSGLFQTLYTARPSLTLVLCTSFEYHVLVTLPLLVLSAPFRWLLSVGVASLLISLGVCVAAAIQAELPRKKSRFWSRPLVALLFFLQPLVRGWARYQGRLAVRVTPPAAQADLEALPDKGEAPGQVQYWAEHGIDRIAFVKRILAELDLRGWQNRADVGWNEYDVEIYGRWNQLQLTTAAEAYAGGKQFVRCRLRGAWTLPARVAFWSALGFELLVIGVAAESVPWIWMLLLTMPLFAWFLEQEQRNLQRLIVAFLDDVAREHQMVKVGVAADGKRIVTEPAAAAATPSPAKRMARRPAI